MKNKILNYSLLLGAILSIFIVFQGCKIIPNNVDSQYVLTNSLPRGDGSDWPKTDWTNEPVSWREEQ